MGFIQKGETHVEKMSHRLGKTIIPGSLTMKLGTAWMVMPVPLGKLQVVME